MKNFKVGRAMALVATLTLVGAPVAAAGWNAAAQDPASVATSSAQLTAQLKAAISQAMANLAGRTVSAADAQSIYVSQLENVIVASGASPEVVVASLEAALAELQASGTLPPSGATAIEQLLARVRAEAQQAPAATGGQTGALPIGAPPSSGAGGGGPDYSSAA